MLVPGITCYVDGKGATHCLPAQTVVPGEVALAARAEGGYLQLVLPSGSLALERGRLPLEPVPVEYVLPVGRDELPWQPERPEHGAVDLSQDWRLLFREPEAFVPWGLPVAAFAAAWEEYRRRRPPRPTFRAGADRDELHYLYPQLAPAVLCYRLARGFLRLPGRDRYAAVAVHGDLTLVAPGGWTATAGVDPLGWRLVVRRGTAEGVTARTPEDAVRLLESRSPVWEALRPGRRRLFGVSGTRLL